MIEIYSVCKMHPVLHLCFPVDSVDMVFYCPGRDKECLADLLITVFILYFSFRNRVNKEKSKKKRKMGNSAYIRNLYLELKLKVVVVSHYNRWKCQVVKFEKPQHLCPGKNKRNIGSRE
jgi:hypothetical protein